MYHMAIHKRVGQSAKTHVPPRWDCLGRERGAGLHHEVYRQACGLSDLLRRLVPEGLQGAQVAGNHRGAQADRLWRGALAEVAGLQSPDLIIFENIFQRNF